MIYTESVLREFEKLVKLHDEVWTTLEVWRIQQFISEDLKLSTYEEIDGLLDRINIRTSGKYQESIDSLRDWLRPMAPMNFEHWRPLVAAKPELVVLK